MDDIAATIGTYGESKHTSEDIDNDIDQNGESNESQKNVTNASNENRNNKLETDIENEELPGGHKEELDVERNNTVEDTASDDTDSSEKIKEVEQVEELKSTKTSGRCCKLLFLTILTTVWLIFLTYCYLYLATVCVPVELWCPDPTHTFSSKACCSSLWLNLGSTVGLGNECTIDMGDMEAGCPMYDCYKNDSTAELNVNGCSYVPNTLFNEAACNIHDLCYITPGSTKQGCDDTFVENIILIYCDNVNIFERIACRGRAQLAGAVVSAIDSFYDDSEELRRSCSQTDGSMAVVTGMTASLVIIIITACFIHSSMRRFRADKVENAEDETDDTSEYELEHRDRGDEPVCYCDVKMENCNICDEVFINDLSIECNINEIITMEECMENNPVSQYSLTDIESESFSTLVYEEEESSNPNIEKWSQ